MKLKLHTDYGLRLLIFLARVNRRATVDEVAEQFDVSREHLVKVSRSLVRFGWIKATRGRGGGVSLTVPADSIDVADVVGKLEERGQVLACVLEPESCVLEPGCRLRVKLMQAENAFYESLHGTSVADLIRRPAAHHGMAQLPNS
ncbi:MAG: Rrf2 family nitric oxide-sensitive transcriptional repressor [Pseudohongiellaceae bacterium]|jgi:Rrf2 family nitric oxide-sensitive transcriptional repressor